MPNINEIIPKKAIDGIIETNTAIVTLDKSTQAFVESILKVNAELKKEGVSFQAVADAQKKVTNSKKELTQLEKDQKVAAQAIDTQYKAGIRTLAKYDESIKKANKSRQDQINILNGLIQKEKTMIVATKQDEAARNKLRQQILAQTNALKKSESSMGMAQRNVGNYVGAVKKAALAIGGALGLTAGLAGLVRVMKSAISTISQFEKEMAKVKAITGATDDEFEKLKRNAIALGATTLFKATEVAMLQKEYAKLGFTTREILAASAATLDLAVATESDLAQAATVAGSTIRAFGLNANETQRVVDVMGKSFTSSALDIEKWQEAMKFAAPIAKAAGVSVEETAALMAKLADAGISGSLAGTALKKIFSELKQEGKPLAQTLQDLRDKGVGLAEADTLVGERAKAALLVLLDQIPAVNKLTTEFENASGAIKEMSDIQLNTLASSVTLLGSAWDGLILSFSNNKGVMKSVVDGLSEMFTWITRMRALESGDVSALVATLEIPGTVLTTLDEVNLALDDNYAKLEKLQDLELEGIQLTEKQDIEYRRLLIRISALRALQTDFAAEKKKSDDKAAADALIAANKSATAEAQAAEKKRLIRFAANEQNKALLRDFDDELDADIDKQLDAIQQGAEEELRINQEKIDEIQRQNGELKQSEIQELEDLKDKRIAIAQASFAAASMAGEFYFQQEQQNLNALSSQYAQKKAFELELAEGNQEQINAINQKYAKKEALLKKKQAESDKRAAIFRTIIAIAEAVTVALSGGPVVGIVLAGISAALGAVQLATIVSQPIPEFYKGTESAPDGVISVGEKGRELIETKSGKLLMATHPTITSGLKGAKIYSNPETERILNAQATGHDSQDLRATLERNNNKLIETIKNKSELHINARKGTITDRRGNYYRTYRNRIFK